ncbi:hypothetical protein ACT453_43945, partial [Bacillus sp. D-CC]
MKLNLISSIEVGNVDESEIHYIVPLLFSILLPLSQIDVYFRTHLISSIEVGNVDESEIHY